MRKSKHSDEPTVAVVKQVDAAKPITEVAREFNASTQTLHRWREKFGCMQGSTSKE